MNDNKTVHLGRVPQEIASGEEQNLTHTMRLSRKAVLDPIRVEQRAYLEISWGGQENIGVELARDDVRIGRHPACDIPIPLSNVSREHARVLHRGDEYAVEDLNSTNGTFVNGVRVVRCVLRNNDQIQLGDAKILFFEEKTRQR
jgi:pSer/pThr/pTyr-binding forkhead associated (FHA) protein